MHDWRNSDADLPLQIAQKVLKNVDGWNAKWLTPTVIRNEMHEKRKQLTVCFFAKTGFETTEIQMAKLVPRLEMCTYLSLGIWSLHKSTKCGSRCLFQGYKRLWYIRNHQAVLHQALEKNYHIYLLAFNSVPFSNGLASGKPILQRLGSAFKQILSLLSWVCGFL